MIAGLVPVVFVLLWSTGFIGAKLGLPYAEPFTFLSLRFALVAVLLGAICIAVRAPWPRSRREAMHIAVAGVLVHAGYLGGVFNAIENGLSAGAAALIVGLQPVLTACLAGPLLGERITRLQWLGFALGLLGVVFVLGPKANGSGAAATSLAFAFVGLISITAGTLYQKRFAVAMDLRSGSMIQFAAASALLAPLAWSTESMRVVWSGEFMFALAWLVFVLSLGAITLLNLLLRRGAASSVASLFYLTPGVTALIAWAVFGERLGWVGIAGLALAALAVGLVNMEASPVVRATLVDPATQGPIR
ncbi:MAG: DMT family transporter [Proteobacteria bacterium]|nr:DMT family transporter [Burkholderiales bacterium]